MSAAQMNRGAMITTEGDLKGEQHDNISPAIQLPFELLGSWQRPALHSWTRRDGERCSGLFSGIFAHQFFAHHRHRNQTHARRQLQLRTASRCLVLICDRGFEEVKEMVEEVLTNQRVHALSKEVKAVVTHRMPEGLSMTTRSVSE